MIRPAHRRVVEQGFKAVGLEGEVVQRRLQRWGYADTIDDLSTLGYHRLVDYFILCGFRTRARPILSNRTRELVHQAYSELGASKHIVDTDLRRQGVADLRDLDGQRFLDLLAVLERRGIDLEKFRALRREVTPNQLKVLGMARKATDVSDRVYYEALQLYGGVNSGADLDSRGRVMMMLLLEHEGFQAPGMKDADPGLASRPGFASAAQVRLIETLWREWSGGADDAALNAWLERYYRVSALRFLPAVSASKAITALKAMKARAGAPPKVTA